MSTRRTVSSIRPIARSAAAPAGRRPARPSPARRRRARRRCRPTCPSSTWRSPVSAASPAPATRTSAASLIDGRWLADADTTWSIVVATASSSARRERASAWRTASAALSTRRTVPATSAPSVVRATSSAVRNACSSCQTRPTTPNASPFVAIRGTAAAERSRRARTSASRSACWRWYASRSSTVTISARRTASVVGRCVSSGHEPAADGRAQQVAVDERDADLVGRRDVGQRVGQQRDQLVAGADRGEVASEVGEAHGLGPLGVEVLGEERGGLLGAAQPTEREGQRDGRQHGTGGDDDRRPHVGGLAAVGADLQRASAGIDLGAGAALEVAGDAHAGVEHGDVDRRVELRRGSCRARRRSRTSRSGSRRRHRRDRAGPRCSCSPCARCRLNVSGGLRLGTSRSAAARAACDAEGVAEDVEAVARHDRRVVELDGDDRGVRRAAAAPARACRPGRCRRSGSPGPPRTGRGRRR